MTTKVRIDIVVDGKKYGKTHAFSHGLNYTKKQMILATIEGFKQQLEKELTEENEDERF